MPQVTSFVANESVKNLLDEIPWGKRSKIINDLILEGLKKLHSESESPDIQKQQKSEDSQRNEHSNKSETSKTTSEPVETSASNTSAKSSEQQITKKQLYKYLHSEDS